MAFCAPNEIKINKHTYTRKQKLVDDYYSYRCKNRKECSLTIKIKKEELEKLNDIDIPNIKYIITSRKTMEHTCNQSKENNEIIESKEDVCISLSDKQIIAKAKELILRNIDKPFSFHKNNLIENNYKLI